MAYIKKTFSEMVADSYNRAKDGLFEIEQISDVHYLVHNLEKYTNYVVTVDEDEVIDCECPHHVFRGVCCKHMVAVSLQTYKRIV